MAFYNNPRRIPYLCAAKGSLIFMISRRNIRVKVMQALYTVTTSEPENKELFKKTGSKLLDEKLSRSTDLFIISILYTFRIAQYAEKDAQVKASRYLRTEDDLNVSIKIAGNEFMWATLQEATFTERVKQSKADRFIDDEWIKKIYQQLVNTQEYQAYINAHDRQPPAEKAIMQFIWEKLILENEALMEYFIDELPDWEDDREMTAMLMQNFFKNNNQKINYLQLLAGEKKEYAHELLHTVVDKEEYCMELIKPKLVNWDTERVALIDMLLLRMGICELLFFPTIPTKVTINEYIEIGKLYSTPQSGHFINGVLDNILKDLVKENKIVKEERSRKS